MMLALGVAERPQARLCALSGARYPTILADPAVGGVGPGAPTASTVLSQVPGLLSEPRGRVVRVTATRDDAEKHLRALAGEDAVLREDQWVAIDALVTGRRRALVVQRTGWGKSAVYFVATALLRADGAGPTVI